MNERVEMRQAVQTLVELLQPAIDRTREFVWEGDDSDQFWELLKRGAAVRQYEGVNAILKMVDAGVGHFGVTLLRPSYEELLWIEYLQEHEEVAKELVLLIAQHELSESLEAQNGYLGGKVMAHIGFTQKSIKQRLAASHRSDRRLREIGRELGWSDRGLLPSVAFIARKVKRKVEYNFIYHGTSRYAHFSPQEIFRRVWGRKGRVTIASDNFGDYWSRFAMYWGTRIFLETVAACELDLGELESASEVEAKFIEAVKKLTPVEIITTAELEPWPDK